MATAKPAYETLFEELGKLLIKRATSLRDGGRAEAKHLVAAIPDVIADLTSPPAKAAIDYAFTQLDPRVLGPFLLELQYVIARLQALDSFSTAAEEDDAGEDAKTAKDSLEDLLGVWLPDWLKKLLKVLNELIDLIL
jgi:hypothetical protein